MSRNPLARARVEIGQLVTVIEDWFRSMPIIPLFFGASSSAGPGLALSVTYLKSRPVKIFRANNTPL
jgi:hypothetical protein